VAVGVPEIVAVPEPAVKVTPDGSEPLSVIAADGVPLARTVKEKEVPDLTVSDAALVKAGADAVPTVRVKDWMAVPDELVAMMKRLFPPPPVVAVGVPAMVAVPLPLLVKVTPAGRFPNSDNVGAGEPVVVTVKEKAVPFTTASDAALVNAGACLAPPTTVMLRLNVAVEPEELVALMVTG
jgi:hypothetical protein